MSLTAWPRAITELFGSVIGIADLCGVVLWAEASGDSYAECNETHHQTQWWAGWLKTSLGQYGGQGKLQHWWMSIKERKKDFTLYWIVHSVSACNDILSLTVAEIQSWARCCFACSFTCFGSVAAENGGSTDWGTGRLWWPRKCRPKCQRQAAAAEGL